MVAEAPGPRALPETATLAYMRLWGTVVLTLNAALAATIPNYTSSGELIFPNDYREWVFLSAGVGMTYGPAATANRDLPPFFDNVFVTREAYRAFLAGGKWPDKTMFVLEIRFPQSHGSINQNGYFQSDVAAMEMAIKDEDRFPQKWAYFSFQTRGGVAADSAKPLGKNASCFACHVANGAVDNTFIQFYPTLLPVAQSQGTLKASFRPWTPSPAALFHTISAGGWASAKQSLDLARKEDPGAVAPREASLEQLGRLLFADGRRQDAARVLEYAASAYPAAGKVQAALSEILEADNQSAASIAASHRALLLFDADSTLPPLQKEALAGAVRQRIARLEGLH